MLLLVHRMPYPPNKGDKVRSYHLLQHLVRRHRVFLGTFIDDPDDEKHVDTVRGLCAGSHFARLAPPSARLRSLRQMLNGGALTVGYYRDAALAHWARETIAQQGIDTAIVFSSSMAQYVEDPAALHTLVDFVDVDSEKWMQYARAHRWPLSWIYRREGRALRAYERSIASAAQRVYFTTTNEAALFTGLVPDLAGKVEVMGNGVDASFFSPDPARVSPFPLGHTPVVFTGAMDYWPNVDAVSWFAKEVMPALHQRNGSACLYVVGRNPGPEVRALAGDAVVVTGTVPDVRPYLQHAAVAIAPLRVARGIQNKVLEAMAMARPVVVSKTCGDALEASVGVDLVHANDAADYVREIELLLSNRQRGEEIGRAGRSRVLATYSWETRLSCIDLQIHRTLEPTDVEPCG